MNPTLYSIAEIRSALLACGWDADCIDESPCFVQRVASAAARGVEELARAVQGGDTLEESFGVACEIFEILEG